MRCLGLTSLLILVLAAAVTSSAGGATAPTKRVDPGIRDGSEQTRLDRARRSWKAAGVSSYSFRITRSCFCPRADDIKIVVRGGRPAARTASELLDVATVPRLFRLIRSSIDREVARLDVTYGKRGVPSEISIDGATYVADDEFGYSVRRFTRLT